jgi:hypothetical protein
MINYTDSTVYPFNTSSRLYKVKFETSEMLVKGSDLSLAELQIGKILSIEPMEMEVFTPLQSYIIQTSADLKLAEDPNTEVWRRGPNWT